MDSTSPIFCAGKVCSLDDVNCDRAFNLSRGFCGRNRFLKVIQNVRCITLLFSTIASHIVRLAFDA